MARCTACSTGVISLRGAAGSSHSGIRSDSTQWRAGTFGITGSTRWAAVCDVRHAARTARGAEPTAFAAESDQLAVAAVATAQPQETVREDAALEERVELVVDELRQTGAGGLLGSSEKTLSVQQHLAVQRGPLGAVALVLDRGAIRRPMPCTRCSRRDCGAAGSQRLRGFRG